LAFLSTLISVVFFFGFSTSPLVALNESIEKLSQHGQNQT
jgi:hypothetical protein